MMEIHLPRGDQTKPNFRIVEAWVGLEVTGIFLTNVGFVGKMGDE